MLKVSLLAALGLGFIHRLTCIVGYSLDLALRRMKLLESVSPQFSKNIHKFLSLRAVTLRFLRFLPDP